MGQGYQDSDLSRFALAQRDTAEQRRTLVDKLRAAADKKTPTTADPTAFPQDIGKSPASIVPRADVADIERTNERAFLTVEQYIQTHDVSVRLWNCVQRDKILASFNVFDAIAEEGNFRDMCKRVQSMGTKTIDELVALLKDQPPELPLTGEGDPAEHATAATPAAKNEAWAQISLADALGESDQSVRLERAMSLGALKEVTVQDFLEGSDNYRKLFNNQLGFGAKTLKELSILLQDYVDQHRSGDSASGQGGIAELQASRGQLSVEEVRSSIAEAIRQLDPKQSEVISKRYGLGGAAKHTLNDIALQVHVTRERVRQVESKALRILGTKKTLWMFERLLTASLEDAWASLSQGRPTVSDDTLVKSSDKLDPLVLLSIDVLHGGVREWLLTVATNTSNGWIRSSADAERLGEETRRVLSVLSTLPTPTPLRSVAVLSGMTPESISAALATSRSPRIFEGYVVDGHLGSRAKRTVAVHRIARENYRSIFDLASLVQRSKTGDGADDGTSRNIAIVVDDAPHLFAHLFESFYVALGAGDILPAQAIPYEWQPLHDGFEEGSIGAWLTKHFRDYGPTRLQDLRRAGVEKFGNDISETSINAILVSNPSFRRIAPGVFDIYGPQSRCFPDGKPMEILLDERQCRIYCQARHAGAPVDFFPAWSHWYEMHLAEWAKNAANNDLFRSLMHVSEPQHWPTLANWTDTKSKFGRWCLSAPRRYALGRRLPAPEQFLSALAYLCIFRSIGWIEINRTTSTKLDNHDAADILAMMAIAGLVEAPPDWQEPHQASPTADQIFREGCRELHEAGALSWDTGVLADVLLRAERSQGGHGWIEHKEFITGLAELRSGAVVTGGAFNPRKPSGPVDAEQLFSSDEWSNIFGG